MLILGPSLTFFKKSFGVRINRKQKIEKRNRKRIKEKGKQHCALTWPRATVAAQPAWRRLPPPTAHAPSLAGALSSSWCARARQAPPGQIFSPCRRGAIRSSPRTPLDAPATPLSLSLELSFLSRAQPWLPLAELAATVLLLPLRLAYGLRLDLLDLPGALDQAGPRRNHALLLFFILGSEPRRRPIHRLRRLSLHRAFSPASVSSPRPPSSPSSLLSSP